MWNKSSFLLFVIATLAGLFSPALAQESVPGDACPTVNLIRHAGGPETSGKGYYMTCQGGVWVRIMESDSSGNLGIKQAAPKAPLHVGGEAILGSSTGLSCNGDRAGGLRYNATSKCLELCDGLGWTCISVAACGDATPDIFDFTDLANQATSALVASNILQVKGISCVVNVNIAGEGSPQFRICADAGCGSVLLDWATTGTIDNSQYLQLRLTTSAAGGDTHSATVSVGTFAEVWNATPAGDCAGSPAPGTICPDGTVYAGLSPDGNVKMYTTRCDAGQNWDGAACAGPVSALTWNDGFGNWTLTSAGSSNSGTSNTAILIVADSNSVASGIQPHYAAQYCNSLSASDPDSGGHADWYLPSSGELSILYGYKDIIGNFSASSYWSSTESTNYYTWSYSFSSGASSGNFKYHAHRVRCVRR